MSATTKAEAQRRVRQALAHVQRAQEEMGRAETALSNLLHAAPQCSKVSKTYEQIRATWYSVRNLQQSTVVDLDGIAAETFEASTREGS